MELLRSSRAKAVLGCLSAVLAATVAAGASAFVVPDNDNYAAVRKPLVLRNQGAFYVGGVPKVTNYANSATAEGEPNQLIIGAMYAQFQIPLAKRPGSYPLIMMHGGGYAGSCLEATPDGREGWLPFFVRNGIATYVVDQAGRGRSGFDRSVLHEARITGNVNLIETLGVSSANTIFTGWFGHLIPEGSTILDGTLILHGDPGDPDPAERHGDYPPAYPIPPVPNSVDPNIEARVDAIGPPPNPANNTYLALETYKWGVPNSEHTLPMSTCPTCTPTLLNASNTWSPRALAEMVEKLGGAVVATHSQSGIIGHHTVRLLKERGALHTMKGLITIEGSCSLPMSGTVPSDYDAIPYLAFKGDYTNTSQICVDAVDALNASPTRTASPAEYIKLDDPEYGGKFDGVTHMMMMDTKNIEVAEVLLRWTLQNVPNDAPR